MLEDIIAEAARKANTRPASHPSWAQVFIASLEASGFVIVPIEATDEMVSRACFDFNEPTHDWLNQLSYGLYRRR